MIKRVVNKIVAFGLVCVLTLLECISVKANTLNNSITSIEDITDAFFETFEERSILKCIDESQEQKVDDFYYQYGDSIRNLGYEPHIVYAGNYEQKEKYLDTSFKDLAMNEENTYLLLLETNSKARSNTSVTFSYPYNGKNYTLRRLTVTGADNSSYVKASSCNLLSSTSETLIKNCLNTALYAYLSAVSKNLGTIASICGLSVSNIGTAKTTTLNLNCATNWTREYTQVYRENEGGWISGSCVEFVKTKSYLTGDYYDKISNSMKSVPQKAVEEKIYSSKYNDYKWKNQTAIVYVNNGNGIKYDITGSVKYSHNGKVKITHYENF